MSQFSIHIAGKAAVTTGQTIYPAVIAASIVQASDALHSIAIIVKENEPLLVKTDKASTIGIQFEGEETIYGHEQVLRKLISTFPEQLHAKGDLVSL